MTYRELEAIEHHVARRCCFVLQQLRGIFGDETRVQSLAFARAGVCPREPGSFQTKTAQHAKCASSGCFQAPFPGAKEARTVKVLVASWAGSNSPRYRDRSSRPVVNLKTVRLSRGKPKKRGQMSLRAVLTTFGPPPASLSEIGFGDMSGRELSFAQKRRLEAA